MAITEKSRHELYRRLEEILGPEQATTLMEHLPPVGWADVATKDDLRSLETRLDARIDRLDGRIGQLDGRIDQLETTLNAHIDVLGFELRTEMANLSAELHSTLRTNAYLTIGAMAALGGLISAVAAIA